jgi:hypothetical protein
MIPDISNFPAIKKLGVLASFLLTGLLSFSQEPVPARTDSTAMPLSTNAVSVKRDTTVIAKHSPRKAAIRSAILPGLGQIYNKKYWKLPIIYGALGTSAAIFFYNLNNYRDTRFAYRVKFNMRANGTDSALFVKIKDNLKPLSEESLRFYRDQFRRDIDYSALFFVLLWGLNVVDAAVDAHLKPFDVSPDLSLEVKPGRSQMAGTSGLSLVLNFR